MKSARERMDIIAAYREAGTYRGAAEIAGTTHKTVKRVIARHEAGAAKPERAARGRNYDGVAGLVAERVEKTAGRISAKRLLPAARAAGFTGSDRNFRRLVARAKQAWRRDHHRYQRKNHVRHLRPSADPAAYLQNAGTECSADPGKSAGRPLCTMGECLYRRIR